MQVYMGGIVPISIANWKKNSCLAICLAGCDFKCFYCNTHNLLDFKEEYLMDILEAKRQINSYSNQVETVLFTGGEPGLQRQAVLNLARHCKQIGLDVGMCTNGSKPNTILSLIREDILSFVDLDLKAPFENEIFEKITKSKTFFKQTSEIITSIKETLDLLKKNQDKIQIFFRTTLVPDILDNIEVLKKIANEIKDIHAVWFLQAHKNEDSKLQTEEISYEELILFKEKLENEFPSLNIEIV